MLCLIAVGIAVAALVDRPLPLPAIVVGATVLVVAVAALGWDRYRGLGHASPAGYLVTRAGSLDRHRICLESDGIIGWTVRQTFFQRRAGVATVIAATPAGAGHYAVVDVPEGDAWSLIESVTPGAGDIWARRGQVS